MPARATDTQQNIYTCVHSQSAFVGMRCLYPGAENRDKRIECEREWRWFRGEREREGRGWREGERVRTWWAGVEDEIHSGVSAAFRACPLGHWVKSTVTSRVVGRKPARGVLAVIYTVIRVHNANFNLSRRRRRRRHCHPQLVIRWAPIFRKSCPEHERNQRMKRRWGEAKGRGRGRGWGEGREGRVEASDENERGTKQLPRVDGPRDSNGVLGRSIFIVNLSIDDSCRHTKHPGSNVDRSWQIFGHELSRAKISEQI